MLFWVLMILLRLVWLQVVEHTHYRTRAEHQHTVIVPIAPIRGELRDRRGGSLAISLKVESLFCTPPAFYPDYRAGKGESERSWGDPDQDAAQKVAAQLAPLLDIAGPSVLEKLLRRKPFVWIERQLPPAKAAAIRALKLDGVDFLPESKRQYPRGSLACQILGFTNIDGVGQLGIERTFDEQLAGKPGELIAPRDAKGRLLILEENFAKIPVNGSTLQLTLDATIQHIVEDALEEGVGAATPPAPTRWWWTPSPARSWPWPAPPPSIPTNPPAEVHEPRRNRVDRRRQGGLQARHGAPAGRPQGASGGGQLRARLHHEDLHRLHRPGGAQGAPGRAHQLRGREGGRTTAPSSPTTTATAT